MSEDAKKSLPGPLSMKHNSISISDDRKPLPASAAAAGAPPGKRVIIKSADMFGDMQKEAINIAIAAFEKNSVEKDVAEHIKKEFDKKHGPTWHCIVGRNFGMPLRLVRFHWNLIRQWCYELEWPLEVERDLARVDVGLVHDTRVEGYMSDMNFLTLLEAIHFFDPLFMGGSKPQLGIDNGPRGSSILCSPRV